MKLQHIAHFGDFLDKEWSWRFHELSTMKLLIQKEKKDHKNYLYCRSGILLLYAHWEGFIKNSGNAYVNFVSFQRHTNQRSKVADNFIALDVMQKFNREGKSDFFYALPGYFRIEQTIKIPRDSAVSTKSNLNFERFKSVVYLLGLDINDYLVYEKKINDLVDTRNTIAHGQERCVFRHDAEDLYKDFLKILVAFKERLFEMASRKMYYSPEHLESISG